MTVRNVDLKSPELKGSNDLSTLALYYYRLLYDVTFAGSGIGYRGVSKSVKDFNYGERRMYGRVDRNMMPMYVNEDKLSVLESGDGTKVCRALDFVADAFRDFRHAFRMAVEKNQISQYEGFMTVPEPQRAYISPTMHFREYRMAMYELFAEKLKADREAGAKISDFDSFVPYFDQFIEDSTSKAPFTFSAFMRSKYASVHMTGLAIDLMEIDASKDKRKVEMVFDNPNYPFYENMAMQFGFSIDKHMPFRLVADLGSPSMQRYMRQRGYETTHQVFKRCYRKTYVVGYNNFKSLMVMYYNSFVSFHRSTSRPAMDEKGKYVAQRTFRNQEDLVHLNIKYGEEWFLEKYASIRNMEETSPLTPLRIKQLSNRAHRMTKIKGKARALQMLNRGVIKTDTKSGSIHEKKQKRREQKTGQQRRADQAQRRPGTFNY